MKQAIFVVLILSMAQVLGCKSEPPPPAPTPAAEVPQVQEVAPKVDPPEVAEEQVPKDGFETDPSATDTVVRTDGAALNVEEFPRKGELQRVLSWTDKYGTNAVVFSREKRGTTGAALTATHGRLEGDGSWTVVREFKEFIDTCEFDLVLEPYLGEWSITDLDKDGVGEATFAWNADCVSDVSPTIYKMLMTEDGAKYTLRGHTRVGEFGGEFKADPEFTKAPEGFQAHAEKAWAASVELN